MLPSSSQYVQPPPQSQPQPQTEMILVPLGRKNNSISNSHNNNKSLPSIVEHPLEEEQESIACNMWTPLSPVKWPRSRSQLPNPSQGSDEGRENNFYNGQLPENTSSSEVKESDHGISRVVTSSANTMVSSSPIAEKSIPSVGMGSMNLTAIDIEQLIAAEVEKRIAARDAIAMAKTAEAVAISADAVAIAKTAQAVAVSTSRTLHEWKNNETLQDGKQVIRRNSIGGDVDVTTRRGSPGTYSATTTTTTTTETNVIIGNVELESLLDTPTKPRSTSMGGDVSAGSPPFSVRDDPLCDPISQKGLSSSSSTAKGLSLSLPSPRAKQPFTPERARAAMLAATQLGPLANATGDIFYSSVISYAVFMNPSDVFLTSFLPAVLTFFSSSTQWRSSSDWMEDNK